MKRNPPSWWGKPVYPQGHPKAAEPRIRGRRVARTVSDAPVQWPANDDAPSVPQGPDSAWAQKARDRVTRRQQALDERTAARRVREAAPGTPPGKPAPSAPDQEAPGFTPPGPAEVSEQTAETPAQSEEYFDKELDEEPVPLGRRILALTLLLAIAGAGPLIGGGMLGMQAYVIASDSMAPVFERGDMIVTRPGTVDVGSVIVYEGPDGTRIAHRVVAIEEGPMYKTRGDANDAGDSFLVKPEDVRGVMDQVVPGVGWPWLLIGPAVPWILMGLIDAYIVMALWEAKRAGTLRKKHVLACLAVAMVAIIPPAASAVAVVLPGSLNTFDGGDPSPVAMEAGSMEGATIAADANSATIDLPAERLWKQHPLWLCDYDGDCTHTWTGNTDPTGAEWTYDGGDWTPEPTAYLEVAGDATGSFVASLQRHDLRAGWYDADWSSRKSLTIDHTLVAADVTDFPVLIDITDTDLVAAQADGDDLLFTDASGTKLSHELESFDAGSGALRAWVEADLAGSSDTTLYLYYGNDAATSQQDIPGTWSNGFVAVYHMDDLPTGDAIDSQGGDDATPQGSMTAADLVSAQIGDGIDMDGSNDYYQVCVNTCTGGVNITDDSFTVSAWVQVPAGGVNDDEGIISKFLVGNDERYHLGVNDDASGSDQVNCRRTSGGSQARIDQASVPRGQWAFIACTYDGAQLEAFVDGSSVATVAATGNLDSDGSDDLLIGKRYNGRYFEGSVDEVRIIDGARSASWIATEHTNQNNPGTFASVGAEQDSMVVVPLSETEVTLSSGLARSAGFGLADGRHTLHLETTGGQANLTAARLVTEQTFATRTPTHIPLAGGHVRESGEWYDTDWNHRKQLTVSSTNVDEDLSSFPVLVSFTDADLASAQVDGGDILFTDTAGAKLDHEVEAFNQTTGALRTWVEMDVASASDTAFWMYYGNPTVADQENVAGTWSNGFAGIWHMDEAPPAGQQDSANGFTAATQGAMDVSDQVSGPIGDALDLDGTNDYLTVCVNTCSGAIDITDDTFTLTGWAYVPAGGVNDDEALITKFLNGNDERYMLGISDDPGATDLLNCRRTSGSQARFDEPGVTRDAWNYLACVYTGSQLEGYINGGAVTPVAASGNLDTAAGDDLIFGKRYNARYFEGQFDELRIHDDARSAGWIKAEYHNQNDPTAFVTAGSEESAPEDSGFSAPAAAGIYRHDASEWDGITSTKLRIIANGTGTVRLWDLTAGTELASIDVDATEPTVRTISASLTSGNDVVVQSQGGASSLSVHQAGLVVQQSSFTKTVGFMLLAADAPAGAGWQDVGSPVRHAMDTSWGAPAARFTVSIDTGSVQQDLRLMRGNSSTVAGADITADTGELTRLSDDFTATTNDTYQLQSLASGTVAWAWIVQPQTIAKTYDHVVAQSPPGCAWTYRLEHVSSTDLGRVESGIWRLRGDTEEDQIIVSSGTVTQTTGTAVAVSSQLEHILVIQRDASGTSTLDAVLIGQCGGIEARQNIQTILR